MEATTMIVITDPPEMDEEISMNSSSEIFPSTSFISSTPFPAILTTISPTLTTVSTMAANVLTTAKSNSTKFNFQDLADDIVNDPHKGYLAAAVLIFVIWAVYLTLYNSRLQGKILTSFLKRFVFKHHISVGSFSMSLLTGKVMFREVEYVNEDYSIRVVDGLLRFKYWVPYIQKNLNEDMSHSEYRLMVELNGLKVHLYNRSELYSQLEKFFGLESLLLPEGKKKETKIVKKANSKEESDPTDMSFWTSWRDFIPVIKFDLNMSRFAFGNRLVASTLVVTADKTEAYYSTKPAACSLDYFMHTVNATIENLRIILAPSPKFTGPLDEPPRFMGEGFVVLSSTKVQCYYYQDQPGVVPSQPRMEMLPTGESVAASVPVWGMNVRSIKGTVLSYGPWADRQRDHLFHFFFPQDYQNMKVTSVPNPGELRAATQFVLKLNFLSDATLDFLFSKDKETKAVHMSVQRGSNLEYTMPWVTSANGYTAVIKGQLLHLDSSTSLAYRNLAEAETLDYDITVSYPRVWNHRQNWNIVLNGSKMTYHFLYTHKSFFQELQDDWSSKSPPDLYHFVPYIVDITLNLQHFELVTLANECNWVDCSSKNTSNAHVAFCGEILCLKFSLPFHEFLPETVPLVFSILGEDMELSLYLPTTNTTHSVIQSIERHATLAQVSNGGLEKGKREKWRNFCDTDKGWVDCWSVPQVILNITYTYHPMPPIGPSPQANVSTPEKEELLLSPIRAPHRSSSKRTAPGSRLRNSPLMVKCKASSTFDPTTLSPDLFSVELFIVQPSSIRLYGAILRQFVHLKENIFGEFQSFTDMTVESSVPTTTTHTTTRNADSVIVIPDDINDHSVGGLDDSEALLPEVKVGSSDLHAEVEDAVDCRKFRPFEVKLMVKINNVTGHLMKACNASEPVCPYAKMDSLVFEMNKQFAENRLQLNISPLIVYVQPSSYGGGVAPPNAPPTSGAPPPYLFGNTNLSKGTASSQGGSSNVNTSRGSSSNTHNTRSTPHVSSTGTTSHPKTQAHSPGFVMLSGLQMRGHAMFSGEGLPLDAETLEYAWLIELTVGSLSGRISTPQMKQLVTAVENFIMTAEDAENCMRPPQLYHLCYHDLPQAECSASHCKEQASSSPPPPPTPTPAPPPPVGGGVVSRRVSLVQQVLQHHHNMQGGRGNIEARNQFKSTPLTGSVPEEPSVKEEKDPQSKEKTGGGQSAVSFCPTVEAIKYKMVRASIDAVHIHIVDNAVDLGIQMYPIRISTCNLHGEHSQSGITAYIKTIKIRNYVCDHPTNVHSGKATTTVPGYPNSTTGGYSTHSSTNTTGSSSTTDTTTIGGAGSQGCKSTGFGVTKKNSSYSGDVWLEAGSVSLGPLFIDAATSSHMQIKEVHAIQQKFLKLHDNKYRKLWFLWVAETNTPQPSCSKHVQPPSVQPSSAKCGCVGGCAFFGSNRNGASFFKFGRQDVIEGLNVAQFKVNGPREDLGYGQSLLRPQELVFSADIYSALTVPHYDHSESHSDFVSQISTCTLSAGYSKGSRQSPKPDKLGDVGKAGPLRPPPPSHYARQKSLPKEYGLQEERSQEPDFRSLGRNPGGPNKVSSDSPGSLSDLRLSVDTVNGRKMPSSLSLQAEVPLHAVANGGMAAPDHIRQKRSSRTSLMESPLSLLEGRSTIGTSQDSFHTMVHRTTSLNSEVMSEAFYSADEEQLTLDSRVASMSPYSSQRSLHTVPEHYASSSLPSSSWQTAPQYSSPSPFSSPPNKRGSTPPVHPRYPPSTSSASPRPPSVSLSSAADAATISAGSFDTQDFDSMRTDSPTYVSGSNRPRRGSDTSSTFSSDSDSSSREGMPMLRPPPSGGNALPPGVRRGLSSSRTMLLSHSDSEDFSDEDEGEKCSTVPHPSMRSTKQRLYPRKESDRYSVGSLSTNSFMSAVSSQEDVGLVDLQVHLAKPILDCPLLLPSYRNHMTQLRCHNWDCNLPTFDDPPPTGGIFTPCFEKVTDGFTSIKMVDTCELGAHTVPSDCSSTVAVSHPYGWGAPIVSLALDDEEDHLMDASDVVGGCGRPSVTRTSLIVKLKKEIDIAISPVALESVHQFVESLAPVFENMHPMTVINSSHQKSIATVEGKNVLKKTRFMHWANAGASDASQQRTTEHYVTSTYEENCFQQVQGLLTIPRVNITLMQASVVEDLISFSALENTKDLTCVSLISVCLDNINLQFSSSQQSNKSVQIIQSSPKIQSKQKKNRKSKNRHAVEILSSPVYIERSVKQKAEKMMSLTVGKTHAQIRRLKNESTLLQDADITAIPCHRSKVLFSFQRNERVDEDLSTAKQFNNERMGFIMFEAGLEKVVLKAIKREGFGASVTKKPDSDPEEGEKETEECKEETEYNSDEASSEISSPSTTINAETARSNVDLTAKESGDKEMEKSDSSSLKDERVEEEKGGYSGDSEQSPGSDGDQANVFSDENNSDESKDHQPSPTGKMGDLLSSKIKKKDVTSFSGEIKSVWLNFAAPPHTPITRRIDYTRLDWNLLSTASPSINAWMNPCDRLSVAVSSFMHNSETRRLAVMASMMADALDVPGIHVPDRPRYLKVQPVSQTLQEDPSCQLCNVLRRYLLIDGKLEALEVNLTPAHMPKLATLRQAIIVLSRQWKNVLYIPSLIERNVRPRAHVCFKLSHGPAGSKPETSQQSTAVDIESAPYTPLAEVKTTNTDSVCSHSVHDEHALSSNSTPLPPKPGLPSYPLTSSRASVDVPIRSSHTMPFQLFKLPSVTSNFPFWKSKSPPLIQTPRAAPPPRPPPAVRTGPSPQSPETGPLLSPKIKNPESVADSDCSEQKPTSEEPSICEKNHDLYTWMANQDDYKRQSAQGPFEGDDFIPPMPSQDDAQKHHSEAAANLATQGADSPQDNPPGDQFLAAHEIFAPLLVSIGVQTQEAPARALQQLGPNVCVNAKVDALRVHIAESEASVVGGSKTSKTSQETPAFLCQRASLNVDISKVAGWSGPALFVSRSALRRHTSTKMYFELDVNFVSQEVNMPLLRLLLQIASMFKNAKQTQQGLREQRPSVKRGLKTSISTDYPTANFETNFPPPSMSSVSEDHEKVTLSSIGEDKGDQRDSVGSSISLHKPSSIPLTSVTIPTSLPPPGPPSSASVSSSSRMGRPQTFAQRLRSSTKLGRGYMNFGVDRQATHSPLLSISISNSGITPATQTGDKISSEVLQSPSTPAVPGTPRCWRNIYCLLDLYTTTPETKTIGYRRRYTKGDTMDTGLDASVESERMPLVADRTQALGEKERTPIIILGVAKVHVTRLSASLSGLKLNAKMNGLQCYLNFKETIKDDTKSTDLSVTGHINYSSILLLEGCPQQTVVRVTIDRSQAMYNSASLKGKDKNTALLSVGEIEVNIPQHPVILHDMMTRGTKQLSTTLQELRVTRPGPRLSRGATIDESDTSPRPSTSQPKEEPLPQPSTSDQPVLGMPREAILHPLVVSFTLVLHGVCFQAALLPSLQAQYRMGQLRCRGITGSKAKFTAHLPTHRLSFSTKLENRPTDSQLPSEACIELPYVQVKAEFIQEITAPKQKHLDSESATVSKGGYLNGVAEIGTLEHSLTTDLLNHLVFVQKVFMKEVNEVVQKMSGGDRPVPLWTDDQRIIGSSPRRKRFLFSFQLKLKGITMTGTTPTQSAVRLETSVIELQLSNRVDESHNTTTSGKMTTTNRIYGKAQVDLNLALGQLIRNDMFEEAEPELQQLAYFKTRINLRNAFHNELSSAHDEGEVVLISLTRPLVCVQPLAVDRAVLVWLNYKNAYDYWNEQRASLNKEVISATQQVFEKVPQIVTAGAAVSTLGSTSSGVEVGSSSSGGGAKSARVGGEPASPRTNLFLQLTVDDLGVCLPLNPANTLNQQVDSAETRDALVLTLESTSMSACNSGSLVCNAKFTGFCMRFAPEFETSLDEWKPDVGDPTIMNLCTVSEGTYEVCSKTRAPDPETGNAKWLLHVGWQMEGVDLLLDVNIGKQLSSLARTLTTITGSPYDAAPYSPGHATPTRTPDSDEDGEDTDLFSEELFSSQPESASSRRQALQFIDSLPAGILDPNLDPKQRAKLLEIEMNEQAKTVAALKSVGASESWVKQEMKRLQELEAAVFYDFRRDVIQKIRRQSVKANSMRDRLGLPSKFGKGVGGGVSNMSLSKSFRIPSPTLENSEPVRTQDSLSDDSSSEQQSLSLDDLSAAGKFRKRTSPDLSSSGKDTSGASPVLSPVGKSPILQQTNRSLLSDTETDTLTANNLSSFATAPVSQNNAHRTPKVDGEGSRHSESGTTYPQHHSYDPGIDLELDVQVCVNSGQCILYNKDFSKEEEYKARLKKERSFSGVIYDLSSSGGPGSPGSMRRKPPDMRHQLPSLSKLRAGIGGMASGGMNQPSSAQQHGASSSVVDCTVIFIPGLDVKVHYESHNESPNQDNPLINATDSAKANYSSTPSTNTPSTTVNHSPSSSNVFGQSHQGPFVAGKKHASLFTWVTLQSIPEETVICPHILDFLEMALEPLPVPQPTKTPTDGPAGDVKKDMASDVFSDNGDGVGTTSGPQHFFPVDVIVYFHMQPCTIRFSCQPVSRVECLLKLPSLNLVFSSKRANDDSLSEDMSANINVTDAKKLLASSVGGLSVTGVLEDFLVYVFHPYGGAMAKRNLESERKDALSVTVAFVKFQVSRTRKIKINEGVDKYGKQIPGAASDASRHAVIRFSTIVDIGTALFKYDMRRLAEILAFPKAWYRRTIVRRLFLGDLGLLATVNETDDENGSLDGGSQTPKESHENPRRESTSNNTNLVSNVHSKSQQSFSNLPSPGTSQPRSRDKLWLNLDAETNKKTNKATAIQLDSKDTGSKNTKVNKSDSWETLVLFAANFTKLNVHMNMGNVMGNVVWTTKGFQSNGRLSIGSSGHKDMFVGLGLGSSNLEAKNGIVGGIIELSKINMYMKIKEDPGVEPDHTVGLDLFACQSRLDYMGTSVLMIRVSSFGFTLRDEWTLTSVLGADDASQRGATIFILGDLEWDQLQLLISKSTTSDLLKMYNKLEEFFTQQFKSSRLVFFSLQPNKPKQSIRAKDRASHATKKMSSVLGGVTMAVGGEVRHHRHWQRALAKVSGLTLKTLALPLPVTGTVLGGSLTLHGNSISLACFHGINFRSKSWALFSLKEPLINFVTEVQDRAGEIDCDTHIEQTLVLSLGVIKETPVQHVSMATVSRITRNMMFPPQFRTLHEWFHYAFNTSELDNVDRFPVLSDEISPRSDPNADPKRSSTGQLKDHNHTTETIFAFPALKIHLMTKQKQGPTTPDFLGAKPPVETSLDSRFQDHIFVTVDAENFFFLHDLIISYIKDTKDKMGGDDGDQAGGATGDKPFGAKKQSSGRVNEPTQFLQQDWREFSCASWKMEPTVRLLSWAAKNLEPYGVDYILNKLGFSQASTTIPKWLQRGCMDPLDKVLSIMMYRIVVALQDRDNLL